MSITKAKKRITLPTRFEPYFWAHCDGRAAITKEIRRRFEELKRDSGVNSHQKELLAQRALFISIQLETMECRAMDEGIDIGVYTQMTNTLLGILKSLGLEPQIKQVADLKSYVESKA